MTYRLKALVAKSDSSPSAGTCRLGLAKMPWVGGVATKESAAKFLTTVRALTREEGSAWPTDIRGWGGSFSNLPTMVTQVALLNKDREIAGFRRRYRQRLPPEGLRRPTSCETASPAYNPVATIRSKTQSALLFCRKNSHLEAFGRGRNPAGMDTQKSKELVVTTNQLTLTPLSEAGVCQTSDAAPRSKPAAPATA